MCECVGGKGRALRQGERDGGGGGGGGGGGEKKCPLCPERFSVMRGLFCFCR